MSDSPSIAHPSIQELIRAVDEATSAPKLMAAMQALAVEGSPAALPTLIAALGYNNPGVALVAMAGLVQLGDVAVIPLMEQLDDYNYGARAYGIRALSAIGDPRSLEVLLQAAQYDFAPSVRRAATKGLGALRWWQTSNPTDLDGPSLFGRLRDALSLILQDGDWSLRYAAIVGLQTLATSLLIEHPGWGNASHHALASQIQSDLQNHGQGEADLAVRSRIGMALEELGKILEPQVSPTLLSQTAFPRPLLGVT